jgi:putative (di)nucleoside polyphosphate hydrolase
MQEKRYRPNVAAVVLSSSYPQNVTVFIGHRSDMQGIWQFPQGGIDNEESTREAIYRELKEEIGTDNIEILCEYPEWEHYDFPENAHRGRKLYDFDGQKQKYFLVRLKNDSEVNIQTKHPEFDSYKFVKFDELFELASHFKKPIYKKVITYFRKEGFI